MPKALKTLGKTSFRNELLLYNKNALRTFYGLFQLSFTLKSSVLSKAYMTQMNIYGAFIAKIVSREVYSWKRSILDTCLGPKYASYFWRLLFLKTLYFFKVFYTARLLKSVISFKYFTSFNSLIVLLNI